MISKDYKQNKAQVLALYDEYVRACESVGKKVNESIKLQAEKIRDEIFNIMILGEAKSGKSTFINAYFGKEVVPMDVRQCTSAIIKIRKGDKFELVAKTAGGGKTTVEGYDKIRDFLKAHAAVSDKYRNIPITTINNELLIKYKSPKIPKHAISKFLEAAAKDNIFNMNIEEYNKLIKQYIADNARNWGKIITEIEITYQLPEHMQGITIIDSPGVGAGGNIGKIAEEYIKDANAIIFVKSLNGQALESSSFMNFFHHSCTNRKKESLFLVLTGKSNLRKSEFESLKEQTIEMYKNDIKEEKIIFVDSKVQLFLNKCRELGTEEKIDEYFDDLENAGDDFPIVEKYWLKSRGNISQFEDKMKELSDFGSVQETLDKFKIFSNYIQIIEFLENLEKEYIRYKAIYSEILKIARENVHDPDALKARIEEKKVEIYTLQKHVRLVADSISERLNNDIVPKMTDNIINYATTCRDIYMEKLTEHMQELEAECEKLLAEQDSNEKCRSKVKDLEKKVATIEIELTKINRMKGKFKNNVG